VISGVQGSTGLEEVPPSSSANAEGLEDQRRRCSKAQGKKSMWPVKRRERGPPGREKEGL